VGKGAKLQTLGVGEIACAPCPPRPCDVGNCSWWARFAPLARSYALPTLRLLAVLLALCEPATAQDWPTRAVRVVSPFAAGGSSDTVGRVIGESLSEKFGQQFVLENRGGAGGLIGSSQVAGSPADGWRRRRR
jgi:hypothetical protein